MAHWWDAAAPVPPPSPGRASVRNSGKVLVRQGESSDSGSGSVRRSVRSPINMPSLTPKLSFRRVRTPSSKEEEPLAEAEKLDWKGVFISDNPIYHAQDATSESPSGISGDDGNRRSMLGDLPDVGEHAELGSIMGVKVSHLQTQTQFSLDAKVAQVIEQLRAGLGDDQTFQSQLPAESVGASQAAVLYSPDMLWSNFIAALGHFDSEVAIWAPLLCTPKNLLPDYSLVVAKIRHVALVLPAWDTPTALWTPEVCAATRVPTASFAILVSPKDERTMATALMHGGLALGFFDSLLVPGGTVSAVLKESLKAWVIRLIEAGKGQLPKRDLGIAIGHVNCAVGEYKRAIELYNDHDADLSLIVEAYKRMGKFDIARASLEATIPDLAKNPAATLTSSLQLLDVFLEMHDFNNAKRVAEALLALARSAKDRLKEADCHERLAKIFDALGQDKDALFTAEIALAIRRSLGNLLKTADALDLAGRLCLNNKANESANKHLSEAVALYTRTLGPLNCKTLESMHDKARALMALGEVTNGLALLKQVHFSQVQLLGSEHPSTMRTMDRIVDGELSLGNVDEARSLLESLFLLQQSAYGDVDDIAGRTLKRLMALKKA